MSSPILFLRWKNGSMIIFLVTSADKKCAYRFSKLDRETEGQIRYPFKNFLSYFSLFQLWSYLLATELSQDVSQ